MGKEIQSSFKTQAYKLLAKKFFEENMRVIYAAVSFTSIRILFDKWARTIIGNEVDDRADFVNGVWDEAVILINGVLPAVIARGFLSDYKVVFASDHPSFEWAFEDWCRFIKLTDEKLRPKVWKEALNIMVKNSKKARRNKNVS